MLYRQDVVARSAVVPGVLVAAGWVVLEVATDDVDVWTVGVLPVVWGVVVWLFVVFGLGFKRVWRLRDLAGPVPAIQSPSPEWDWLERAWLVTRRIERRARRALPRPVADRMRAEAAAAVGELYRLAGHASEIARAVAQIDPDRKIGKAQRPAPPDAAASGQAGGTGPRPAAGDAARDAAAHRAWRAASDALAVRDRLLAAREAALARLAAETLALEALHARMLELGTLRGAAPVSWPGALDDLTTELEGLRLGIEEANRLSRQVLEGGAWPPQPTRTNGPKGKPDHSARPARGDHPRTHR